MKAKTIIGSAIAALIILLTVAVFMFSGTYFAHNDCTYSSSCGVWVVSTNDAKTYDTSKGSIFINPFDVAVAEFIRPQRKISFRVDGAYSRDGIQTHPLVDFTVEVPFVPEKFLTNEDWAGLAVIKRVVENQIRRDLNSNTLSNYDEYIVSKCVFGTCYNVFDKANTTELAELKKVMVGLNAKWNGMVGVTQIVADYK